MQKVFVKVLKAMIDIIHVIYAPPGNNEVFHVALRGKCLSNPDLQLLGCGAGASCTWCECGGRGLRNSLCR